MTSTSRLQPDALNDASAATGSAGLPPSSPASVRTDRRLRLVSAAVILVLSAVGFLMLASQAPAGFAEESEEDSLSSLGEFLQPALTTETARIRYEVGDLVEFLPNGGVVPLSDDLRLEVAISPYPPTKFDIAVDLRLTTAAGVAVGDAAIAGTWDMPVMPHGPFTTDFVNAGDGHYVASFDFFMFGPWEIVTDISSPSHETPTDLPISIYVWPE